MSLKQVRHRQVVVLGSYNLALLAGMQELQVLVGSAQTAEAQLQEV